MTTEHNWFHLGNAVGRFYPGAGDLPALQIVAAMPGAQPGMVWVPHEYLPALQTAIAGALGQENPALDTGSERFAREKRIQELNLKVADQAREIKRLTDALGASAQADEGAKRKRRTKAEMEAARAEQAPPASEPPSTSGPEPIKAILHQVVDPPISRVQQAMIIGLVVAVGVGQERMVQYLQQAHNLGPHLDDIRQSRYQGILDHLMKLSEGRIPPAVWTSLEHASEAGASDDELFEIASGAAWPQAEATTPAPEPDPLVFDDEDDFSDDFDPEVA